MSNKTFKTHVLFLIDSSGSMESIKKETINHFNQQISQIKSASRPNMETFISLFTFHEEINEVMFQVPLSDVQKLSSDNYKPEGMTSVIDAIDSVLEKASSMDDGESSFFVSILSDGSDNSSKISVQKIAKKISKLQDTGNWTFNFIGANQDVEKIAHKLKIPQGNTLKYDSHSLGVSTMTETQSKSLGYFFTARSYGTTCTRGFYGAVK